MIGWTDSTTPQNAGATVNGASHAVGGNSPLNYFVAQSYADQAGTLAVQRSVDGGANWRTAQTAAASASQIATVSVRISGASGVLYRASYTNGGTNQTVFELTSSMTEA